MSLIGGSGHADAPSNPSAPPPQKAASANVPRRVSAKQAQLVQPRNKDHVIPGAAWVEMELIDRERRMIERRIKSREVPQHKKASTAFELQDFHASVEQAAHDGACTV